MSTKKLKNRLPKEHIKGILFAVGISALLLVGFFPKVIVLGPIAIICFLAPMWL